MGHSMRSFLSTVNGRGAVNRRAAARTVEGCVDDEQRGVGRETAQRYDVDPRRCSPRRSWPTVDLLERLAEGGPALEFAIGTGGSPSPWRQRGVPVTGIELSEPMVAQLRRKIGEERAARRRRRHGDHGRSRSGVFSLVYLVWNSISNLRTQAEQVQCFRTQPITSTRWPVRDRLWVPRSSASSGAGGRPDEIDDGHLVFDTYDLVTQQCTSHHYHRDQDGSIRYGAGHFRYIWPSECDLMAQLAGLELESRSADWDRQPLPRDKRAARVGLAQDLSRCVRPFDLRGYVLDPLANPRKQFCSTHVIHVGGPVRLELSEYCDDQLGFGDGELDRDAIRRPVSHVHKVPEAAPRPPIGAKAALSTEQVTPTKPGARGVY